jgi:hypothetical protein
LPYQGILAERNGPFEVSDRLDLGRIHGPWHTALGPAFMLRSEASVELMKA